MSRLTHRYEVPFVHKDIQSGYNLDSNDSSADYKASDFLGATAVVSGGSSPFIPRMHSSPIPDIELKPVNSLWELKNLSLSKNFENSSLYSLIFSS